MGKPNTVESFWAKVDKSGPGGCWLWTGTASNGYGQISISSVVTRAHRFAYEIAVGPIPAGLVLDHLCRNRACCNPAHLEPVTNQENILRGQGVSANNKRKTHCVNGHPLTGENLSIDTRGDRRCWTCRQERMARDLRKVPCPYCGVLTGFSAQPRHIRRRHDDAARKSA